jgi:hypothetical protein
MHPLGNDFGSIAVIAPVLRQSSKAGNYSAAAAPLAAMLLGVLSYANAGSRPMSLHGTKRTRSRRSPRSVVEGRPEVTGARST